MPNERGGRWKAAAVPILVLALAAGCGDGDTADGEGDDVASDETTSTTEETTTTTLSPEEEVLAAYGAAQEAIAAAYDPASPDHPDLIATVGDPLLKRHQDTLRGYEVEGVSDVAVDKQSDPRVVSVDSETAVIENCLHETMQLMDSDTREAQGQPRGYTLLIHVDLEKIDGTWKVTDSTTVEETC